MLFNAFTVIEIVNDYTGDKLQIALTKEEYDTYTINGEFSDEFMKLAFAEDNISKQIDK